MIGSKTCHSESLSLCVISSSLKNSFAGHPAISTSAWLSSPDSERNEPPTETIFSAAVCATSLVLPPRSSSQPGANRSPTNLKTHPPVSSDPSDMRSRPERERLHCPALGTTVLRRKTLYSWRRTRPRPFYCFLLAVLCPFHRTHCATRRNTVQLYGKAIHSSEWKASAC